MRLVDNISVKNKRGLHIRPSITIVRLLQDCESNVYFTYKNLTVNAKDLVSVILLNVHQDAEIKVVVEGADAEITMRKLIDAFENLI